LKKENEVRGLSIAHWVLPIDIKSIQA